MVSSYVNAYENTDNVLAINMGNGKMAFVSRDDCALACACAAMSDLEDQVIDVNGPELLTVGQYVQIANEVTGHNVKYVEITDEQMYAFFPILFRWYGDIWTRHSFRSDVYIHK